MCKAIVRGVVDAKLIKPEAIFAYDPNETQLKILRDLGCQTVTSLEALVRATAVIVLAVKPDVVPKVLKTITSHVTNDKLVVSVAAGTTLATLESLLPIKSRVIRVMPNTPCLVGQGVSAISAGKFSTNADVDSVKRLFDSIGISIVAEEKYLDAVTGLSGSGPAYVFQFIEALADGGVRAGLPRDIAMQLAMHLVKGSAHMVCETGTHPAVLKDNVASPGGTTIAGIHALEQGSLRATMNAVLAATVRARELGQSKL